MKRLGLGLVAMTATVTVCVTTTHALAATVPIGTYAAKCRSSSREFDTSGWDTDVTVRLCVRRIERGRRGARRIVHQAWVDRVAWSFGGGMRKFDKFEITYRVERGNAVRDRRSCAWTRHINKHFSGSGRCTPMAAARSGGRAARRWSADGVVTFNYDADGKGDMTWRLRGTPPIG